MDGYVPVAGGGVVVDDGLVGDPEELGAEVVVLETIGLVVVVDGLGGKVNELHGSPLLEVGELSCVFVVLVDELWDELRELHPVVPESDTVDDEFDQKLFTLVDVVVAGSELVEVVDVPVVVPVDPQRVSTFVLVVKAVNVSVVVTVAVAVRTLTRVLVVKNCDVCVIMFVIYEGITVDVVSMKVEVVMSVTGSIWVDVVMPVMVLVDVVTAVDVIVSVDVDTVRDEMMAVLVSLNVVVVETNICCSLVLKDEIEGASVRPQSLVTI